MVLSDDGDGGGGEGSGSCSVGIESTVIRPDPDSQTVTVFRRGGVSQAALEREFAALGLGSYKFLSPTKAVVTHGAASAAASASSGAEEPGQAAPGQLVTHYAPDVDTLMLCRDGDAMSPASPAVATAVAAANAALGGQPIVPESLDVSSSVVIDFGGQLVSLRAVALQYRDLSPSANVAEASRALFESLRWSEGVAGAKQVLLADPSYSDDENAMALWDRMFRAASGRRFEQAVASVRQ